MASAASRRGGDERGGAGHGHGLAGCRRWPAWWVVTATPACAEREELLPRTSLDTLQPQLKWGRVALTTGPVAPEAVTFGALGRLLLRGSPSRGRFRHSTERTADGAHGEGHDR